MEVNIELINIPSSVANWRRSLQVPKSELPELTADQKSLARDFGMSQEDYARSVWARHESEKRYRRYAEHFAELLVRAARLRNVQSAEITYDGWENKFHCWLTVKEIKVPLVFDANIVIVPVEKGDRNSLLNAAKAVKNAVEWAVRQVGKRNRVESALR